MSEISVQAASTKKTLIEIANQAKKLADGLQNAAPGDQKNGGPNASIEYLQSIAVALNELSLECDGISHKLPSPPKPDHNPGM